MKRLLFVMATVLVALLMLSVWSSFAQSSKVPITYPGDTKETIARRIQWIEGAKKEGKVIWWGSLDVKSKMKIIAEFNKIYPFIKVEHWRGRGAEIASKLEPQHAAGRLNVDITLGGEPFNYPRWRDIGIMEPYIDIIPGIERMHKGMYSRHGDWVVPGNNGIAPQYNTNLVSVGEAPKSWEDLLDPKWKGQIGFPASSIKHWSRLALAEGGWGIEKTEDFLSKLRQQELVYGRGFTAMQTLMIAGEFKISVQGYLYHALQAQNKGAPVEWVRVNPVLVTGSALVLIRGGPDPNAARLFLEWILSPQGLLVWEKITLKGAIFPGAGTIQAKALKGLRLVYRDEDMEIKMNDLDLVDRFSRIVGLIK